jgi:hypothetical protein
MAMTSVASMGRWVLVLGIAAGVAGCGTSGEGGGPQANRGAKPALVGRVASVPAAKEFVLIQSYGAWSVPAGEPVFTAGDGGRSGNLLPTGERLGQFVAADLRSGEVLVGDPVYFRPKEPKPGAAGPPPATAGTAPASPDRNPPGGPAGDRPPAGTAPDGRAATAPAVPASGE